MQTRLRDINSFSFFCITIHPVLRVLSNDVIDAKKRKEKIRKKEKKEGEKRGEKNRSRSNLFTRYTHTHMRARTYAHTARYMICRTETTFFFPAVSAIDRKGKKEGASKRAHSPK